MVCHHLLITKSFGMKINKLLGIVVLGILLSGNAYSFDAESYKKLKVKKAKLIVMQVVEPLKKKLEK